MNRDDERILDAIVEGFARAGVDARNLAIDVMGGAVMIRGSVPTDAERCLLGELVSASMPGLMWRIDVSVRPVAPSGSPDNRGRSPLTGTSAHSAYESRHQFDR